jgi:hypothetical protein
MVMPGFSKCPHHPAFLSTLAAAIACLPLELGSISDLLAKLRSHPKLGRGDDCGSKGTDTTNRSTQSAESPPAKDLDEISQTQPTFVRRCDGHSTVCTTALSNWQGSHGRPDPPGGTFERDVDGRPNGILTELAATDTVLGAKPP